MINRLNVKWQIDGQSANHTYRFGDGRMEICKGQRQNQAVIETYLIRIRDTENLVNPTIVLEFPNAEQRDRVFDALSMPSKETNHE